MEKSLFNVRENWDIFRPYLLDEEVEAALKAGIDEFTDDGTNRPVHSEPWLNTRTDFWRKRLDELVQADPEFKQKFEEVNDEEDEDMEVYFAIHAEISEKYRPKKGEYDWYQMKHACYQVAPFIKILVQKAIKPEDVWIKETDTHAVVCFIADNVMYYVDLLNEWPSVEELEEFMLSRPINEM